MGRKSLQLRRKKPLPKGRLVLNMTNRDRAKWEGSGICYIPGPWDDTWVWDDNCFWQDNGAELVTHNNLSVYYGVNDVDIVLY